MDSSHFNQRWIIPAIATHLSVTPWRFCPGNTTSRAGERNSIMRTTDRIIDLDLIEASSTPTPADAMRNIWTAFVAWVRVVKNRRAANRLLELDERMLSDIGLSPCDLHAVLRDGSSQEDPSMQLTLLARKRGLRCLI